MVWVAYCAIAFRAVPEACSPPGRPPTPVSDDAEIQAGFAGELAQLGRGHARGVHLHSPLCRLAIRNWILIHAPQLALMGQAENIDVGSNGRTATAEPVATVIRRSCRPSVPLTCRADAAYRNPRWRATAVAT
jgi:hypothetical protein